MEQIDRIQSMEQIFQETSQAVEKMSEALEQYVFVQAKIKQLDEYYQSSLWQQDYDDDCAGKFPPELHRGVLSEDGIYNMLCENTELMQELQTLMEEK